MGESKGVSAFPLLKNKRKRSVVQINCLCGMKQPAMMSCVIYSDENVKLDREQLVPSHRQTQGTAVKLGFGDMENM